jgi:hypothetical protein
MAAILMEFYTDYDNMAILGVLSQNVGQCHWLQIKIKGFARFEHQAIFNLEKN